MFQWDDPVVPAPTCISVHHDLNGRFMGLRIGPGITVGEGIRAINYEEHDRIMAHPERYRYDTPEIQELIEAQLVVSCQRFVADGQSYCSVEVRCPAVETARISINEDEIDLPTGELLFIRTTEIGAYQIRLIDPNLWAEEPTHYVMAIAAEDTHGN